MADDPNPALRSELSAALGLLGPQIGGLHDLAVVSISADLRATISTQITNRERRRDLIQAVLDALDHVVAALRILEQDGYPDIPVVTIVQSQFNELQDEAGDLKAAVAVFAAPAQIADNLASATHPRSQPVPAASGP